MSKQKPRKADGEEIALQAGAAQGAAAVSTVSPTIVGMFGTIGSFDKEKNEWPAYMERLEQYFIANGLDGAEPAAVKRCLAIFLTVIGDDAYLTLCRLVDLGTRPSEYTYEELTKRLSDHWSPKPLEITERCRLRMRRQEQGENIKTFLAALRKLAEHCEYGTELNKQLRDCFVAGLRSRDIQKKLVGMRDLTLERAVEIAVGMEAAETESHVMREAKGGEEASNTLSILGNKRYGSNARKPHQADEARS